MKSADKILLWDVDGVLISFNKDDPSRDWRRPLIESGSLDFWEGFQTSVFWEQCLRDKNIDVRDAFHKHLSNCGTVYKDSQVDEIISIWINYNTEINDDALHTLRTISGSGIPCALATNQDGLRALWLRQWVQDNGLNNIGIYISSEIGVAKPEPGFFEKIMASTPPETSRYIFLDDNIGHIEASRKLGWKAYHVGSDFDWEKFSKEVTITE